MIRALLLSLLLATPAPMPATAADRTVGTGSFERLRVEGPFEVRVTPGSPAARLSGDRDAIDSVSVRVEGGTMIVRAGANVWGERRTGPAGEPVVVTLSTPALVSAASTGGAVIGIVAMRGDRIDLAVTGSGAVTLAAATAADLNATVIGTGTITVAGRATRARLLANGPGTIDAAKLDTGDATVRLEGVGAIRTRARYTAQVSNAGLGTVEVTGPAKCVIRGADTGRVQCEGPR